MNRRGCRDIQQIIARSRSDSSPVAGHATDDRQQTAGTFRFRTIGFQYGRFADRSGRSARWDDSSFRGVGSGSQLLQQLFGQCVQLGRTGDQQLLIVFVELDCGLVGIRSGQFPQHALSFGSATCGHGIGTQCGQFLSCGGGGIGTGDQPEQQRQKCHA